MNNQLVSLVSQPEIAATVQKIARELDRDCHNYSPVFIGILKGSFIFLADSIR